MESWKKNEKTPKNCSKITKKSLFFPLFGKKSFLNRTLGLRKSFLNQTTYVLKNRLYQQSFLNRDSFLNRAFLNRERTVPHSGMLLYLHHRNSKLFFHPAKFDNFKDEKISDFKTVSVSQSKNLLDWKLVV